MFGQIGQFLVQALFGLFIYVLLLRFWMQALRAPFRNPLGQAVISLTNWAVVPTRRLVPPFRTYDMATLLLALLAQMIMLTLLLAIGAGATGWPRAWAGSLFVFAIVGLVRASLHLLIVVVILNVLVSWLAPYSPLQSVLDSITRPFYGFFRRFIPPLGNIDLSPLFVILIAQVLLIVLDNLPRATAIGL